MHALTVAGATKRFGAVQALAGATFDLAEGEMLALLGPNGAGKTTLIRAIAGRLALDSGDVRVFGAAVRPRQTPPDLGIVPQEIALYPLMTARENLDAFGRLLGLSGPTLRERVAWALDRTALADRASDLVKGFSGGMKRRLNIAAGVLHRPRVVLLDEPTAGVDPQSRDRIYDMLAELAASGVSLLVTTHHLEEAEARCSRTVIIDHGKVVASGTLAELVDQTVGRHRTVSLRVDRDVRSLAEAGAGAALAAAADPADGRIVRAQLRDVATELPPLLARVAAAGLVVEDVDVRGPSLQSVFIHLTGRELRE